MSRIDGQPLIDEEKEKPKIEWENKILSYLMPGVGLVALIFGAIGFALTIGHNVGIAVFLIILAVLGLGGIAYGVVAFLKKRKNKGQNKEKKEPDQQ